MRAQIHQSCRGPEVCDDIESDKMRECDFDEWFKQESHKLLCLQRLLSLDMGGL